ncbi:ParB/RepB/Spo0J family partition protein [Deinococcus ficus]|uniref:ParB-like N-terminal domain-containing protein n=1 Tax=Deinococcus ficus TaxID=317577 RepID=A0A221T2R3_9DEIO|nr:ParB/RepB/Spo0J family partition protein [Deinococcus ficus]ASN83207.1 hypothetical protein DFI_18585 [Deinococcus ficus]
MSDQRTLFDSPLALTIQNVPTDRIKPGDKKNLIPSINKVGILQAILLKPSLDPEFEYEIVDGSRRHHTAMTYKLPTVNALVTDGSSAQIAAARAIANTARSPNPVQEAIAWREVMAEGIYADVQSLARDLGVPVKLVKKRLKLATLPAPMLDDLQNNKLAEGTAERISRLDTNYRALALEAYRTVTQDGTRFTDDHLQDIRRRKSDETKGAVLGVLDQISIIQPLIALSPATVLAEQVRSMARDRGVTLDDLARELGIRLPDSPQAAAPVTPGQVAAPAEQPAPAFTEEPWDFGVPLTTPAAAADLPAEFGLNVNNI